MTHGFADSFQPLSPLDALPSHPHNAPNRSASNHVQTHDQMASDNVAADPFIMSMGRFVCIISCKTSYRFIVFIPWCYVILWTAADLSTVVLVDSSWSQCPIDDVFALHRDIESMSRQPRLAIRRFTKFFAYQGICSCMPLRPILYHMTI